MREAARQAIRRNARSPKQRRLPDRMLDSELPR
jgi:hypothetical protein